MHIPDSAISPASSLVAWTAMAPLWHTAGRRLRESLTDRQVPLLALASAFCFTIMMFNLPVPGGTTVHATGAALVAIVLGPWAALAGISVTVLLQALFFADGGLLSAGANCLSMAFAAPFSSFAVYRLLRGAGPTSPARNAWAAGAGAYVGVNVAALVTAFFLGIQPAIAQDAAGRPLYFPFGLALAVPAILIPHLLVAGVAEGALTAAAVRYLSAARVPLADQQGHAGRSGAAALSVVVAILVALTPLGLLAKGSAWGEESSGSAPGLALFPEYLRGNGALAYALACAAGAVLVCVALLAVAWLLRRRSSRGRSAAFIERTLLALAERARDTLLAESWARRNGLLQRLDPRAKLAGILTLVLAVSFLHRAAPLALLLLLAILLAQRSSVPLRAFLARVGLGASFALGIALPALLGGMAPGPLLVLLLRIATAAAWVTLLPLTTRWGDLLLGLAFLRPPRVFLTITAFAYRYLGILSQSALDLFVGRKSRAVGPAKRSLERAFLGGAAGALLWKTLALSEEVQGAMLARGFTGEVRSPRPLRIGAADGVWLASVGLAIALAISWSRLG